MHSVRFMLSAVLAFSVSAPLRADPEKGARTTTAPAWMGLPDLSSQFTVGYEPTHTNYEILRENLMAIAKKVFLRTGKGVLTIETPANQAVREKYLALVRERCPECRISEVRESHGTLSYQIAFADGSYIRSSLDAGALEWQTSPGTIPEQLALIHRYEYFMFELPREAGTRTVPHFLAKMLGGHVTESGYGGDTFWWAASLKLDAETPEFSRGFFGKDDYNASPVKLWAMDQQKQYASVIREHDQRWEVFLTSLETELQRGRTPSTEALMSLFEKRDLMSQKEFGEKLAGIYDNPKQESKLLGKRSKPKYVAQRPGNGLIESRAINPQENAREMELMGRYRLRRFEYIRAKLDQGLDVEFIPETFRDLSANDTAAQAKAIIEELGLDWNDYAHFGPVKDPKPSGREKQLADLFRPKKSGALARDRIYDRILEIFHAKPAWTSREWEFVLSLTEERGTTASVLNSETRRVIQRFSALDLNSISITDLETRVARLSRIVDKFRVPSRELYSTAEKSLQPAFLKLWSQRRTSFLAPWLKHLPPETLNSWAKTAQSALHWSPDSGLLDLQSRIIQQLEVRGLPTEALTLSWYHSLSRTPPRSLSELPELLMEMDERLGTKTPELRQAAYSNLVDAETTFPFRAMREADGASVLMLSRIFPEREGKILMPYRLLLNSELEELGYGLHDHYRSVVLMDQLLAATPIPEKKGVLETLIAKAQETHLLKNNPDTASILERLQDEMRNLGPRKCSHYLGTDFFSKMQTLILGGRI